MSRTMVTSGSDPRINPPVIIPTVPVTGDRNKLREALNVPVPHDLHGRTYAQLLAEEYFMQAVTGNAVRQSVRIAELWEAVVDRLSV